MGKNSDFIRLFIYKGKQIWFLTLIPLHLNLQSNLIFGLISPQEFDNGRVFIFNLGHFYVLDILLLGVS